MRISRPRTSTIFLTIGVILLAVGFLAGCSTTREGKPVVLKPKAKSKTHHAPRRAKRKKSKTELYTKEDLKDVKEAEEMNASTKEEDTQESSEKPTKLFETGEQGEVEEKSGSSVDYGDGKTFKCEAKEGESLPPGCFRYKRKGAWPSPIQEKKSPE